MNITFKVQVISVVWISYNALNRQDRKLNDLADSFMCRHLIHILRNVLLL